MNFIHLPLLVAFVTSTETAGEPCTTAGHLPVVNICTDETKQQDDSDSVLLKANTMQNCTCELSVINQDKPIQVKIQRFDQKPSSSPSEYGCGLILKFGIGSNKIWDAQCLVNSGVTYPIAINDKMTITSLTVNGTLHANEGYCIEVKKDSSESGNKLELKCGTGSKIITYTTISVETTVTTTTTSTKTTTVPTKTITTTHTSKTSTDNNEPNISNITSTYSSVTTTKAIKLKSKENDETILTAAGASVGGFVIIVVFIVVICIYRRSHSKSAPKTESKSGLTVNNDNDDYGLHENVLYIPADLTPKQTIDNCRNTKRISVDIDGNYSTVDLVILPSVEESAGDYSSIDMVKLTPTESNMNGCSNEKTIIAPKPKQKTTIQDDVYSVPDKKRVKHFTAPGENGCEYAVVSKPNKANVDKSEDQPSTSNIYAVVEKKKRMSDGTGTNRKRDSLPTENDGETGQS